jgi:hypothetical protein
VDKPRVLIVDAEHSSEILERLGPLIKASCARVGIDLQEYLFLLQSR